MSWPAALPWHGSSALARYLGYIAVIASLVVAFSKFAGRSPLVTGGALLVGIAMLAGALWPLIVTLWFFFASHVLGRRVLLMLTRGDTEPHTASNLLVGAGLYASLVSVLAHFPVNYPGVYGVGLLLPLLLDRKGAAELAVFFWRQMQQTQKERRARYWLDIGLVVITAVYLAVALLPEVGYDSLVTHLFVPTHLAHHHQWGFDASLYALAVIPMLADWIYAINFMLGGELAARLINVGFIFILATLARDIATWAGGSETSGRLAALILMSTPLTFLEGSTLHVEGTWAAFLTGGALSILRLTTSEHGKTGNLIISGVLLGCALATKAITLLMLPALGGLFLWKWRSWARRELLWPIAAGLVVLFGLGLIPYADAWRITGNPVFPFFNEVFQSPLFPIENFKDMRWQVGFTADMLYAITFHSDRYQEALAGAPGFQWLIFLIPSVFLLVGCRNHRGLLLLLVGVASVILVFNFTATYFRYVYPASVLLISAIAVAFERGFLGVDGLGKAVFSGGLAMLLLLNVLFFNAASWYGDFQLRPIFDPKAREEYMAQRLPERAAVELVNKLNTAQNPVAFISSPFAAGLKADALHAAWYNRNFLDALLRVQSDTEAFDLLTERAVDYVILDKNWGAKNLGQGKGGQYEAQRVHIESVTTEVAAFGAISVRKINPALRFRHELLTNTDFSSKEGWVFSSGAVFDSSANSVLVSESAPVTQSVAVKAGRRYRNVVVARCAARPAIGRVQINWYDAKGSFLKADGITFDCSADWTEHEMTVAAPPGASMAVVYTAGHTDELIAYKRNSLLQ